MIHHAIEKIPKRGFNCLTNTKTSKVSFDNQSKESRYVI